MSAQRAAVVFLAEQAALSHQGGGFAGEHVELPVEGGQQNRQQPRFAHLVTIRV